MTALHERLARGVKCPVCQHVFSPEDWVEVVEQALPPEPPALPEVSELERRRAGIRHDADQFRGLSFLCAILGGIGIILGLVSMGGDHPVNSFGFAGDMFGAALLFYVIAQLIHIRANTER